MSRLPHILSENDIPEAGKRFLLLAAATKTSKRRLLEETKLHPSRLTMYEKGENGPGDLFKKNLTLIKIAEVFGLLPSAVLDFWVLGDVERLPKRVARKIEDLCALSAEDRMKRWQDLGWQQKPGKPGRRPAPPRADD
jgi:hypothetical protein